MMRLGQWPSYLSGLRWTTAEALFPQHTPVRCAGTAYVPSTNQRDVEASREILEGVQMICRGKNYGRLSRLSFITPVSDEGGIQKFTRKTSESSLSGGDVSTRNGAISPALKQCRGFCLHQSDREEGNLF